MGNPTPYSPMGPAPKHVSQDRMAEILRRRANRNQAEAAPSNAGGGDGSAAEVCASLGGDPVAPATLEWCEPVWTDRKSRYGHMFSRCNRYMIDNAAGSYTAYRRGVPLVARGIYLGGARSAKEARELCQNHLVNNP